MTPALRLDYSEGRAHFLTNGGAAFYKAHSGIQVSLFAGQYVARLSATELDRLHLAALSAGLCVSVQSPLGAS